MNKRTSILMNKVAKIFAKQGNAPTAKLASRRLKKNYKNVPHTGRAELKMNLRTVIDEKYSE